MRDPEPRRPLSSIELLFDQATEEAIRAEWDALAAAGMSSLALHTSASNRPHLTLLARQDVPVLEAGSFHGAATLPITLGAPILFGAGARRVLARSILPTAALLDLHAAVHVAAGTGEDAPHSAPGQWHPHVTLARRVRIEDLAAALELVSGEIHGHATIVRRWDAVAATVTDIHAFVDDERALDPDASREGR